MAESSKNPPASSVNSVADLVIEGFAHDEAELRALLVNYRALAQEAMHAHAEEAARRRNFQRKYYALLKEHRQGGGR